MKYSLFIPFNFTLSSQTQYELKKGVSLKLAWSLNVTGMDDNIYTNLTPLSPVTVLPTISVSFPKILCSACVSQRQRNRDEFKPILAKHKRA